MNGFENFWCVGIRPSCKTSNPCVYMGSKFYNLLKKIYEKCVQLKKMLGFICLAQKI